MRTASVRVVAEFPRVRIVQATADHGTDTDLQAAADHYAAAVMPGWHRTKGEPNDVPAYRVLHVTYTEGRSK